MLSFDPIRHVYRYGDTIVPSVSAILKSAALTPDYSMIDPAVLQNAADRGSYADAACDLWDEGTLDVDALDPRAAGYVRGWIKFRKDTGYRPLVSQGRVYHPALRYAGAFDSVGILDGALVLIDRKCVSKVSPTYGIQLAAYDMAWSTADIGALDRRLIVHLKKDGGYKVVPFEDPTDYELFRAAVLLHHYRHQQRAARGARMEGDATC